MRLSVRRVGQVLKPGQRRLAWRPDSLTCVFQDRLSQRRLENVDRLKAGGVVLRVEESVSGRDGSPT
jgi:hypothetical protein